MSTQVKAITLRATYESDLSGFKTDMAAIKSFRRQLEKTPVKIPVRLDLSGVRADAVKAAADIKKIVSGALSTIQVGGGTSKGGIIIPASAMSAMNAFAATGKGAFKEVRKENGQLIQSFEQLAAGIQRVTSISSKGKKNVKLIDTRPLEDFQAKLAEIERKYAGRIGQTSGTKGDLAAVLKQKQAEIAAALNDPKLNAAVRNTSAWQKADRSLDRLEQRHQSLTGIQADRSAKKSRGLRIDDLKNSLLAIDTLTSSSIGSAKGNKGDVAAELARKKNLLTAELQKFADISDSPAFKQAQKAINALDRQIFQAVPAQNRAKSNDARKDYNRRASGFIARQDDQLNRRLIKQSKAEESNARAIANQGVREREINRVLTEREGLLARQVAQYERLAQVSRQRGMNEAAGRYQGAANRVNGQLEQVRLDRARSSNQSFSSLNDQQLKRALETALQYEKTQRVILKNEEAAARLTKDRIQRETQLAAVAQKRQALQQDVSRRVGGIVSAADIRGNTGLAGQGRKALGNLERQGLADMRRLAAATNASGHAFNFHSNALLKNAATFIKWYIPAQAAMAALGGLGKGIQGAIEAQRTFKILGAVFRGSKEDAKLLADETLLLAAANGRSADEAAQASVAWARLGLTRTQILVAMESSLRAANVAEISAAEATAYLTANYKAFGQSIADIPATLDYINALSNKSAAAPKEIFEGIARVGAIAKSSGIEVEALAGIITTMTEVSQRPGAEQGNAVKTILTRLNRPSVGKDLKEQFSLDFTTANGDAKKMNDILTELAAIYPTLNTLEKGRLKNIVAGANQGNRFAIIMDNWTENLIKQAKAGLEANSAMKENEMILDSVSAKLQNLDTSWTRLFHTLGEVGVFDLITSLLGGVSDGVDDVASGLGKLANIGGIQEGTLGKFAKAQTQRFGRAGGAGGRFLYLMAKDAYNGQFLGKQGPPDSKILATETGRMASKSVQARNRVKSLAAGDEAFRTMSRQFGTDGVPKEKILSQFDEAVNVLAALPGGQANVAKARRQIRPLLESGDIKGGRRALDQTAARLYVGQQDEFKGSEEQRAKSIKITEDAIGATTREMDKLNSEMANTQPGEAQDAIKKKLYETEQALKDQQDALSTLQQRFNYPLPDPLAGLRENIDAYLADLEAIGKAYSDLASTFGSSGFSNLDASLKIGAARVEGNLVEQSLNATLAQNAAMDRAGTDPQNKPARDAIATAMQYRLDDIRKASEEEIRKAELGRQTGLLKTAYEDSRKSTGARFGLYDFGTSDGVKLSNRGFGIASELKQHISNPDIGAGDSVSDARELGVITERMVQAKETLFSMEKRAFDIVSERANLESDITEENRKQTEEANRRLAMASREDQLRSAGAAAYLRSRGKSQFSMPEFQFMSDGTRNAISSFAPRSVKGLDETEQDQNERRTKLDQEATGLAVSLRTLTTRINELLPKAEDKAAGIIDPNNPLGGKPATADAIINKGKEEIRMNLNTGPINISLDFTRHVADIKAALQTGMDAKLDSLRSEMRRVFASSADPYTAAAAGAF